MADNKKPGKNPAAVALGRLGGLKGGPARTASLWPAQRKASARTHIQGLRGKYKNLPLMEILKKIKSEELDL